MTFLCSHLNSTLRDVPFGRKAIGQRDLGDIHPRNVFDLYTRDQDDLYARGFSDSSKLYERGDDLYARVVPEVSGLYERAFSEPYETAISDIYARDADLYDLYARKVENIYKRDLSRLNYLFARAPVNSRPSSPAPPAPKTPPRPGTPSTSYSDSEGSEGSTKSAALVGMTRVKTSTSKDVRIVGVNGCTGIFLSGTGFITGAHAAPGEIPHRAKAAAAEAKSKGTVTGITIYSPDAADGNKAATALHADFPNVRPQMETYTEDESKKPGYYEFTAAQGNPPHVSGRFVPPRRSPSPKRSLKE